MPFPLIIHRECQLISESSTYQESESTEKMAPPSIRYIEDLSSKDTEKLTQLLNPGWRTTLTKQWLSDQAQSIPLLPSSLRKPTGLLPKLAGSLPFAPQKANLCESHKGLHPYLIRRIFLQVSAECTTRLQRLLENPRLDEDIAQFMKRIQSVNSLWMSHSFYCSIFRVSIAEESYEMVEGGCEACILATVGGDAQILSDLRASMLGRKKKGLPAPRLLKIVDAWIKGTGRWLAVSEESDALGKEIRRVRRQMQHDRRQARKDAKYGTPRNNVEEDEKPLMSPRENEPWMSGGVPESSQNPFDSEVTERDDNADHDMVASVVDLYANGFAASSANLSSAPPMPTEEDVAPAFRDSIKIIWSQSTGTFGPGPRRNQPSPPPLSPRTRSPSNVDTFSATGIDSYGGGEYLPHSPPPSVYRPVRRPSTAPRTQPAYTESSYSRDALGRSSIVQSSAPELSRLSSEDRARAYRNLMGTVPKNPSSAGATGRRTSRSSADRITRWMDFSNPEG